jgi:uncharacterized protein with HEPN domain
MSRDDATVLDIVLAGRHAMEFVAGMSKDAFLGDHKTQSAVQHKLLVLGEAVKRLSAGYRDQHPEVPWREIAGLRDKLIHGYDNVDLHEVWRIVTAEIPPLLAVLEPLVPKRLD